LSLPNKSLRSASNSFKTISANRYECAAFPHHSEKSEGIVLASRLIQFRAKGNQRLDRVTALQRPATIRAALSALPKPAWLKQQIVGRI
jgi:hypothetical protein